VTAVLHVSSGQGLSCYTANLAGYLAAEWDAGALLARSVRLAVRPDPGTGPLAFSHHAPGLDRLPDGTRLRYAAAPSPAAALPDLAAELAGFGRVLVVVDNARLPWSPARGGRPAPHWLLVDGGDGERWHVVDRFTGLLMAGEQLPHAGWLDRAQLCAAMTPPACWAPEQRLRNSLAFGEPVPVPAGCGALWMRRHAGGTGPAAGGTGPAAGIGGGWLAGTGEVLAFLADFLTERGAAAMPYLDDLWAAAGHRAFAYRWRLANGEGPREALTQALARWESMPRLLRLALESAGRRRPRPTLLRAAFEELLRVEEDLG
jgi:hypothetical protein